MEADWRIMWRLIVGDAFTEIPEQGSLVYYLPSVHAAHGGIANWPPALPLLCRISQVMFSRSESQHVYVRYTLARANPAGANLAEAPHFVLFEDPGFVGEKALTNAERTYQASCAIPKATANVLFPHPSMVIEATRLMNEPGLREVRFNNRSISAGWASIRNDIHFREGDSLILRWAANGELCLGVRRAAGPDPQAIITALALELAQFSHDQSEEFNVDYYPGNGRVPCVVPVALLPPAAN